MTYAKVNEKIVSMRFDADHLARVDSYARTHAMSRTDLVKRALAVMMGDKLVMPTEDSGRSSMMVVEDVGRGDCIHPVERREFLRVAQQYRCLDCGIVLPRED